MLDKTVDAPEGKKKTLPEDKHWNEAGLPQGRCSNCINFTSSSMSGVCEASSGPQVGIYVQRPEHFVCLEYMRRI